MILYCLNGQFFVHLNQTDQQIAVFRHFFYFDRLDAVFGYQTGGLDNIFVCQSRDAYVIFY